MAGMLTAWPLRAVEWFCPCNWLLSASYSVKWQSNITIFPKVYPFPKVSRPFVPVQSNHVHAENSVLSFLSAGAIFDEVMTHWSVHSNFPLREIMRKGNAYRGRRMEVVLDFSLKIWGNISLLGPGLMLAGGDRLWIHVSETMLCFFFLLELEKRPFLSFMFRKLPSEHVLGSGWLFLSPEAVAVWKQTPK